MKYVIDLPDNTHWIQWIMEGTKDHHPYVGWKHVEDLIPYDEPDRKAIEEEVWNFVMNTDFAWVSEVGDKPIGAYSYQEAKTKYDEWKKKKYEIRVGDEVLDYSGKPYIIYEITDVSAYGIRFDGYPLSHNCFPVCYNKKTGRHFDEVEELLKKIGE